MRPIDCTRAAGILFAAAVLHILSPAGTRAEAARRPGVVEASVGSWLDPWTRRVPITVSPDSLAGPDALVGFPVTVVLTPAQQFILDQAQADGSDLVVTKGDGVTPLPREIVDFDAAGGRTELWFRADTLSVTRNEFYLYYGNPLASLPTADGSVWGNPYVAVYHFAENPGNGILKDYGPQGNNATAGYKSVWTSSDVAEGVVGQAWDFDGVTHFVDADAISTPDSSFVISAWAKLTSRSTDFAFQANPGFWHVSFQINETHFAPHYAIANPLRDLRWTPNPLPLDGQFHNFTWVFDGVADTILFYYDGIQQTPYPHRLTAPAQHFYTGHPINPLGNDGVGVVGPMSLNNLDIMNGPADEFRLREGTLPSAWILTEVRNQRSPSGFLTFGSEESSGPVPVRLQSFSATRNPGGAVLAWQIAEDSELDGRFRVFRALDSSGEIPVPGEPRRDGRAYSLLDPGAPSEAVLYRLAEISRSGEFAWLGAAELPASGPAALRLSVPNPLRGSSLILFSTTKPGPARLRVFDLSGREVDRIVDEALPAGDHATRWDGRSGESGPLTPGVYFMRLETADGGLHRKFVILD